jgi:hypothetical protein
MTEDRGPTTEEVATERRCAGASKVPPRSSVLVRPIVAALVLVAWLSGCHRYEPVTAASVARGSSVAVALTDQGTANLGRLLGMGVGTVEGSLVTVSDTAYTLAVHVVRQRNGIETFWKGEQVAIPRLDVAEIRQRRFSRSKSALATVAVIAAAVGAVEAFIGTGSGSAPPGGSGNGGPR